MKRIFLIRHSKAAGQEPEAPLLEEGTRQAQELAEFLHQMDIDYLITSPYRRAVDTIRPLSERLGKEIHTDERLIERVLSTGYLENWMLVVFSVGCRCSQVFTNCRTSAGGSCCCSQVLPN
jgi:2,3-bisphosphoglycerate-dependent phosphoglycerate mutase